MADGGREPEMAGRGSSQILDRRSFEAGKEIFREGDKGDAAFVVESGEVGIYKEIDGERVRLGSIMAGGIFGEMAVIDGSLRMAAAVAETHVVAVRVPKGVFDQKMACCDPFIRGLITIFLDNIRSAHKLYAKRPRSFADYVKVLDAYSLDLRFYSNAVQAEDYDAGMAEALAALESAILRVRSAAAGRDDRRRSVIGADDPQGLTLRAILDKG